MPKTRTILTIFAASPDDVAPERAVLEDVVRELNVTWSATLGVSLELVSWMTHAHPGFGTDAQGVVNQQVGNDYDIFIGMMWTKFGSATGRAGSGTEEEFNRALERYRSDRHSVKIMFYFKDEAVPPSVLNIEQYSRVRTFRERLGREGGLYWTFTSEFESFVRLHLAREIQDWLRTGASGTPRHSDDASESEVAGEADSQAIAMTSEDEFGLFDYMEAYSVHFTRLRESEERLTKAIEELGVRINERADEQRRANASTPGDIAIMRRVTNRLAEDMNQFVARVEVELPIFGTEMRDTMQSFSMAITLAADFGPEALGDVTVLRSSTQQMANSLQSTIASTVGFREMIASTPRLTTEFNRARRKAVEVLDHLVEQMKTGHALLLQVLRAIDGLSSNLPA